MPAFSVFIGTRGASTMGAGVPEAGAGERGDTVRSSTGARGRWPVAQAAKSTATDRARTARLVRATMRVDVMEGAERRTVTAGRVRAESPAGLPHGVP
ncbi:hypothetical protein CATMQ487_24710 [Sphaerotilus microaerophilus]|uniref:Uncharacterized protein n=1 Tax=Sphaerotilus microaerophilus TaxID=2914710 RepID=A0ABM7YM22_9BURK|nr:hypothetical protein CATMQ487_24710 [Sphaerotilus sp. FB-5]